MSITHNKKQISLVNLLINSISAKSAPQILSIKGDCTFLLLNFLIIGLCNSSVNCCYHILSCLIPVSEVFFTKT